MRWKVRCDLGDREIEREFPSDEAMNLYVQILLMGDFEGRTVIRTEIIDWGAIA